MQFGIISNTFAKITKADPSYNIQMWYTLANAGLYKITNSLEELSETCDEFAKRKINLVGILGGDGSISLVLSHISMAYSHNKQILPKIILFKGGTINVLADNLGIKLLPVPFLKKILTHIDKNLPLFEVPVKTLAINQRLGFIFASGIAIELLKTIYQKKTNVLGAAFTAVKYLFWNILVKNYHTGQRLNIYTGPNPNIEDQVANWQVYTLILASTLANLPFGISVFPHLAKNNKLAQLFASTAQGRSLLKLLQILLWPKSIYRQNNSICLDCSKIIIDHSNLPLEYTLDGDLFIAENSRLHIHAGPEFIFCSL